MRVPGSETAKKLHCQSVALDLPKTPQSCTERRKPASSMMSIRSRISPMSSPGSPTVIPTARSTNCSRGPTDNQLSKLWLENTAYGAPAIAPIATGLRAALNDAICHPRHPMARQIFTDVFLAALLDGEQLGESHRRPQANCRTPSNETRPWYRTRKLVRCGDNQHRIRNE
jgi:hypothetical protein